MESLDLDDKIFHRLKASTFESRDEEFNYFKIEYEICVEEYNSLKRKYALQKS